MNILVIGGTRFFGIPMVKELLAKGHAVTIATRGKAKDNFGDDVSRIILDRNHAESMRQALTGKHFDVVIDKIAYCSNDIRYALDVLDCDKYIYMSSTAVYEPLQMNSKEADFDAFKKTLVWCDRADGSYEEVKRQAECALWQEYKDVNAIAVRYPVVMGKDDYTNRLYFYVEHVVKEKPMFIDNQDCQMGFIHSDEAGSFLAFLAEKDFKGAVNGCSSGTISVCEMIDYVEQKTGKKAVLTEAGEPAPYNGTPEYSINTNQAEALGYSFTELEDWIYDLLDYYIGIIK